MKKILFLILFLAVSSTAFSAVSVKDDGTSVGEAVHLNFTGGTVMCG